jgi:hypothetical protein
MTHLEPEDQLSAASEDVPVPTIVRRGLPIKIACIAAALLLLISLSPEFIALVR